MPGSVSPRYWKLTALLAMGACAVLLWRAPPVAATQSRGRCEQRASGGRTRFSLTASGSSAAEDDGSALEPLLSAVTRATGVRPRCRALTRLAREPDEQALDTVLGYTEPKQPLEIRVCATTALGQVAAPASLASLLELLEDRAPEVVEAAARAIAERGDAESIAALLDAARSADPHLGVTLSMALAEVGAPEATALISSLLETGNLRDRDRLIAALGSGGVRGALPLLEKLAGTGAVGSQLSAINALGELGGPEAARALLRLLQQRPAFTPTLAQALSRTRDPSARAALIALAESSPNRNLSSAALQALVGFDDGDVHALMERSLTGSDTNRANMAMDYFASHPDPSATTRLIELARKCSPYTGYSAINALARSGDERGRAVIEELARGDSQLKSPALMALSGLPDGAELARELALAQAKRGGPQIHQAIELLANDDSPEARAALIAVARRNDPHSSPQAISWLGQRGDRESTQVIEELVSSGGSSETRAMAMYALVQSGAPAANKLLVGVLQTGDATARVQAVSALSQSSGPEVEQALINASRDKESSVAAQAASALGQLASPAALARVEELARGSDLQVTRHALMSLMSAPERAAPIARSLSASGNAEARLLAVEVAGSLPTATASGILLAGARDADSNVVRVALANFGVLGNDATTRDALLAVSRNNVLPSDVRDQANQLLAGRGASEPDEE